jgi:hypothetical protein
MFPDCIWMYDMLLLEDLATNAGFDVLKAVSRLYLLVCDAMQFGKTHINVP